MELGEVPVNVLLGCDEDPPDTIVPPDIRSPDALLTVAAHPTRPLVALGQVSGAVCLHEFQPSETRHVHRWATLHDAGVSAVEFVEGGTHLVSVGSDRRLCVVDCATLQTPIVIDTSLAPARRVRRTQGAREGGADDPSAAFGSATEKKKRAKKRTPNEGAPPRRGGFHAHPLSALNICTSTIVATGDDDGRVVLWDVRVGGAHCAVMTFDEHADHVTGILYFTEVHQIVSSGGDTCLCVYDVRRGETFAASDKRKEELTCLAFVAESCDIVCGTPTGSLPQWRYGSWSRPYDVMEGHPRECECIRAYNDNILITGACDGLLRVVQCYPVKRNLCQLGGNARRQPVTRFDITHDRRMAVVCGNDATAQFVSLAALTTDEGLDRLRSRAEQRHLGTLREATAEAEREERQGDDSDESEGWEEVGGQKNEDGEDGENPVPVEPQKSKRQVQRERVAAAQWLKVERKKKVSFQYERKRRRLGGFWGDL